MVSFGSGPKDSLYNASKNQNLHDTLRIDAYYQLAWISYNENRIDSMEFFAKRGYELTRTSGNNNDIYNALFTLGMASKLKGDHLHATYYFQEGLKQLDSTASATNRGSLLLQLAKIYSSQGAYSKSIRCLEECYTLFSTADDMDPKTGIMGQAIVLNQIGEVYMEKENFETALSYFERSYGIRDSFFRAGDDLGRNEKIGYAQTMGDMGQCYVHLGELPKAYSLLQNSLDIYVEIEEHSGIAEVQAQLGDVYMNQKNNELALEYYLESFSIAEAIQNHAVMAATTLKLGNYYLGAKDYNDAKQWCELSLKNAENMNIKTVQRDACRCMYEAHRELGDPASALRYLEKLLNVESDLKAEQASVMLQQMEFQQQVTADSIAQVQKELEAEARHRDEVNRKDRNRNIVIVILAFMAIAAFFMFNRARLVQRAKSRIEREKNRSENLLLNILPLEIAQELKAKGEAEARDYLNVTILFTDFKDFTRLSQRLTAKELVAELNHCFKAFDGICEKYDIEKIKTIGDSYMAAGGIPTATTSSIKNTVLAALEMRNFVLKRKEQRESINATPFEMRVGIHTGHVVAGIVGTKKFQYDIWGDSVNTASRMESSSDVDRVNISQTTYAFLADDKTFVFEPRGKVDVKGKGEVEMYYVELNKDNI